MKTQPSLSPDDSASEQGAGAEQALWAKPDGRRDPAAEAGWFLARERVRRGESLAEAANASRLPAEVVDTIEHGQLSEFASLDLLEKALVRYANHLRFEAAPLIAHFRALAAVGGISFESSADSEDLAAVPVTEIARVDPGTGEGDRLQSDAIEAGEHDDDPAPARSGIEEMSGESALADWRVRAADMLVVLRFVMAEVAWALAKWGDRTIGRIRRASSAGAFGGRGPLVSGAVAGVGLVAVGAIIVTMLSSGTDQIEPGGDANTTVTASVDEREAAAARSLALPTVRIRERALDQSIIADAPVAREEADRLVQLIEKTGAGDTTPEQSQGTADGAATGQPIVTGAVESGPADDVRVVLQATEGAWIRIEDGEGNVVTTRNLAAGDSYRVPNRGGLVLDAHNAGALQYVIDGNRRGRLGQPGDIVIGLPLDPDRLGRGS